MEDLLLVIIETVQGARTGPGSVSQLGSRLPAMALLTKTRRPKEQVRNAYSPLFMGPEQSGDVITGTVWHHQRRSYCFVNRPWQRW